MNPKEQNTNPEDTALYRITQLQELSAELFTKELLAIYNGENINTLEILQNHYFASFCKVAPIHTRISESVKEEVQFIDPNQDLVVVISNHPPFEKTMSPNRFQLERAFANNRGNNFFKRIEQDCDRFLGNIPAGIARRAVLHRVLSEAFPHLPFYFHVIAAELNPPLYNIQKVDGTIIVPYKNGGNGYQMLYNGILRVTNSTELQGKVPIIVGFPEGGNSKTKIEDFGTFHTGIFSAVKEVAQQKKKRAVFLPVVMGVDSKFETTAELLSPLMVNDRFEPNIQADHLRESMYSIYTQMLVSFPNGYFWQGMSYPYGGVAKASIPSLNIIEN